MRSKVFRSKMSKYSELKKIDKLYLYTKGVKNVTHCKTSCTKKTSFYKTFSEV